jgi:opacity protein-like surface antigen
MFSSTPAFADDNVLYEGPFVGLQISLATLQDSHSDPSYWYYGNKDFGMRATNLVAGLRAGWDIERNRVVAGVVAEVNFGKLDTYRETNAMDPSYAIGARINHFGSVRGKLGYREGRAVASVNFGVALSDRIDRYDETDGTGQRYREHGKRVGWVAGAELAVAANRRVFVAVGISHSQFGRSQHVLLSEAGAPEIANQLSTKPVTFVQQSSADTISFSLNRRF